MDYKKNNKRMINEYINSKPKNSHTPVRKLQILKEEPEVVSKAKPPVVNSEEDFANLVAKLSKRKNLANLKEIANSIPDFHKFAKTYAESIALIIKSNEKTTDKTMDILSHTNDWLLTYLDNKGENLTSEERAEVLKNIMEINRMVKELNKENKLFLVQMAAAAGTVIIAVASAILAAMMNNEDNDDIFDTDDYD